MGSLHNRDRHEAPPGSPLLGVAGHRSAGGDPLLLCSRGEARPQDGGRPWRGRHGRVLLPGTGHWRCCLQVDLHRRHGRLPSHGRPPACLGHHGSCARGRSARADFLKVQEGSWPSTLLRRTWWRWRRRRWRGRGGMLSRCTRLPTTSPCTGSSLRLQLMSRQLLRRETTSPPPLLFEVATSSSATTSLLGLRETHKHYLMKYRSGTEK